MRGHKLPPVLSALSALFELQAHKYNTPSKGETRLFFSSFDGMRQRQRTSQLIFTLISHGSNRRSRFLFSLLHWIRYCGNYRVWDNRQQLLMVCSPL